jgi:hypothetical protein
MYWKGTDWRKKGKSHKPDEQQCNHHQTSVTSPEVLIARVVPDALPSDEVEVVDLFGGGLAAAGTRVF